MSNTWVEAKHPRDDGGRFVEVPASHTYPAFTAEVRDAGNGHVTLHRTSDKGTDLDHIPMVKMKRNELPRFLDDLHGTIGGSPNSPDKSVNRAISGRANLLGRGNDGLAFDTDDGNVVKASTSINYHWNNGLRGSDEGANVIRRQVEHNEMLRNAGVPGLLPQKLVEHGDRAYAVMPKVDTKTLLNQQQLDDVTAAIRAMHAQGYTIGDDIQAGVGADGKAYLFDTGAVKKLSDSPTARRMDIEDDEGRLARIHEQHGGEFRGLDPTFNYEKKIGQLTKTSLGKPRDFSKMSPGHREQWAKSLADAYGKLDDDAQFLYSDEFRAVMAKLGNAMNQEPIRYAKGMFDDSQQRSLNWDESKHPRDEIGEFTEKDGPGLEAPPRQQLMFDDNPTGRLFDTALFESSKKAKKKPAEKAGPSLVEQIEDDLKKQHDANKPLGGQKEMFSRRFDAEVERYSSVEWVRAPKGGAISPVNHKHYDGGEFMPVHGESEKESGKKKKPTSSRPQKALHKSGEYREVPEDHIGLTSLVGGHPKKSHLLPDHAFDYLGLTKKQAQQLADLFDEGYHAIPREIVKRDNPEHDYKKSLKEWEQSRESAKDKYARRFDQVFSRYARGLQSPDNKTAPNKRGHWVTIHGSHVFISGNQIVKGPKNMTQGKWTAPRAGEDRKNAGQWGTDAPDKERIDPREYRPWSTDVEIPGDIHFDEWVNEDEPQAPPPKGKSRKAAIMESAQQAAESAGVPVEDVMLLMPTAQKHLKQEQREREQAKAHLRRVSGLNAGSLARMENRYVDHSMVKNWDTTAREFAMEHPVLGFDPDGHDTPAMVWDFLREGKAEYISAYHPQVAALAAEWARPHGRQAGDEGEPYEYESGSTVSARDDESVPFSRRSHAARQKFSRLFDRAVMRLAAN